MPAALVNNTLSGLASGVTEQFEEGRFDSQVSEMINCIPSITRGVLRRNPLKNIGSLEVGLSDQQMLNAFIYVYDRGTIAEQYIIVVPGDGSMRVFSLITGKLLYTATGQHYLQMPSGRRAKNVFKAMTIGDHTFIVNSTVTPKFTADVMPSTGLDDMAFYWIKKTASVVTDQEQEAPVEGEPIKSGSRLQGYEYKINNYSVEAVQDTRPSGTGQDNNTAYKIAKEIATNYKKSLLNEYDDTVPIAYNRSYGSFKYMNWSDSFGNEASLGVWKTVVSSSDLPSTLPEDLNGFIVRVTGGSDGEFDDYYLRYSHANKTWLEISAPGRPFILDSTTMPHVLYRLTSGFRFATFRNVIGGGASLGTSAWSKREAGGLIAENDDPSFIGKPINNVLFYKNRLGFITDDNIILSSTGDYGNFFFATAQQVLDDDPIDLGVASTNVTKLRHAVATSGRLILFADDTQFALDSGDSMFTPTTASITELSKYSYSNNGPAVTIGNKVVFNSPSGGYSSIFYYRITDEGSNLVEATPVTLHLPTYIPKDIDHIFGHSVLGYTFFETRDKPNTLIVWNSVEKNREDLQNAFHKWKFKKYIAHANIVDNQLYILFTDGNLCYMSLETPGDIDDVHYGDEFSAIFDPIPYISYIKFSEFFLRDKYNKGSVRGRYQIRTVQYTISAKSRYKTTIINTDYLLGKEDNHFGPLWIDTAVWNDELVWTEHYPVYKREYYDDDKITVSTNSKRLEMIFRNNELEPYKGFELATLNVEAFFSQRSKRT
jgi:hypothetical protein